MGHNVKKLIVFTLDNNLPPVLANHAATTPLVLEHVTNFQQLETALQENTSSLRGIYLTSIVIAENGINFIKTIVRSLEDELLPIIAESNDRTPEEMEAYMSAGAKYYLADHTKSDLVILTINKAIDEYEENKNVSLAQAVTSNANALQDGLFYFRRFDEANALASFLAESCPNPKLAVIGISEIFLNAIEHGNLGISYMEKTKLQKQDTWLDEIEKRLELPTHKNKYVRVHFKRELDKITIHVTDQGNGFDWQKYKKLDSERKLDQHGRGIVMANRLVFDEMEYLNKGNEVIGTILTNKKNGD